MRISIRKQLLSLFAPFLFGLWTTSAVVSYWLVSSYVDGAFDRHLINSADSVVGRLRDRDRKVTVDLPPAAQYILKHEELDTLYYRVLDSAGRRVDSGDDALPAPSAGLKVHVPRLSFSKVEGKEVRLVEIKVEPPEWKGDLAIVQVAETMITRKRFKDHMLLSIAVPQLLILAVGLFAVWDGVGRILTPLRLLQGQLANRLRSDLKPVADDNIPEEVFPLVQAINQLFARIDGEIKAQRRFISNAAHQLRTPLAGLKTYSSIGTQMSEAKDLQHIVSQLDLGLDRASRIVHQLLALARVDESERQKPEEKIDLSLLISDLKPDFLAQAERKSIELSFEIPPATFLPGDPVGIRHLAANLIENAISYTESGGRIEVRLSASEAGRVVLEVADSGRGIPINDREKIFERFYRVDDSSGTGSGLGLSIVKEVASLHGAEIQVTEGLAGRGSCFAVSFPA